MSSRTPLSRQLTHLECVRAGHTYEPVPWRGLCECGSPLAARYDWAGVGRRLRRDDLRNRHGGLWRFREVLPLSLDEDPVDLGEGGTPLLRASTLERESGLRSIWIKDEAGNPTGSFKARGLSLAVQAARALGSEHVAVPSAGNAAAAMSCFAAACGLSAHVIMPRDTPQSIISQCRLFGADVELIDGLITDAGKMLRERSPAGWLDLSTLREPYRLEGKKTLGYELAEALDWTLPDVILYPTGGGTGLLGMWKAFEELETLGWIEPGNRPRMVSVQTEGCAPIVRAFENGEDSATPWENAHTQASGLRVPAAVADFWILRVLRESGGKAIAVSEDEMLLQTLRLSRLEGVLACPEGGAVLAAFEKLRRDDWIRDSDRVVLFNTGTGLSYVEAIDAALELERSGARA